MILREFYWNWVKKMQKDLDIFSKSIYTVFCVQRQQVRKHKVLPRMQPKQSLCLFHAVSAL